MWWHKILFVFAAATTFAQEVQKPIVVIIPARNVLAWYEKNLASILCQQYDNYAAIYIDDASDDGTYEAVCAYLHEHDHHHCVTVIRNAQRQGALANIYAAVHSCPDAAIVVTLDGDDWVKHEHVLSRINQAYQNPSVWMTYGQFEEYPQNRIGFCAPYPASIIAHNLFRLYDWLASHPRTFYAALFKKIKREDLYYEDTFFDVTWDMAFMYPLLEMAGEHCLFIPDVLYVYNQANPASDFRLKLVEQLRCKHVICGQKPYPRLSCLSV